MLEKKKHMRRRLEGQTGVRKSLLFQSNKVIKWLQSMFHPKTNVFLCFMNSNRIKYIGAVCTHSGFSAVISVRHSHLLPLRRAQLLAPAQHPGSLQPQLMGQVTQCPAGGFSGGCCWSARTPQSLRGGRHDPCRVRQVTGHRFGSSVRRLTHHGCCPGSVRGSRHPLCTYQRPVCHTRSRVERAERRPQALVLLQ